MLLLSVVITYSQTANIQIFHNKPYEVFDIYIDGRIYHTELKYQESLRSVNVPLETKIGVATTGLGIEKSIRLDLIDGKKYILVVNGSSGNQGSPINLKILELENSDAENQLAGFKFLHGVADAPPLDIYLNRDLVVQGQRYGEVNSLIEIPLDTYVIDLTESRSTHIIARFNVELSVGSQESSLLLATGFLNPSVNDSSLSLIISTYDQDPVKVEPIELNVLSTIYEEFDIPSQFFVLQNYPNPFNPKTSIEYDIFDESLVRVTVFDMTGNVVNHLLNERQGAGRKSIVWNATTSLGDPVSSGIYFYKIDVDGSYQIKRMMYLK